MMTLLRLLHSIAAARGDGLRPELLEMITPSATWSDIKRASDAGVDDKASGFSTGEAGTRPRPTNVAALSPRKP
jgi:hypothetical protein